MKDILFTVKQQKRELKFIIVSLILAIGVNIGSIIYYGTEWKELYTQWFVVFLVAALFYGFSIFVRLIFRLIYAKMRKKRK